MMYFKKCSLKIEDAVSKSALWNDQKLTIFKSQKTRLKFFSVRDREYFFKLCAIFGNIKKLAIFVKFLNNLCDFVDICEIFCILGD